MFHFNCNCAQSREHRLHCSLFRVCLHIEACEANSKWIEIIEIQNWKKKYVNIYSNAMETHPKYFLKYLSVADGWYKFWDNCKSLERI